MTRLFVALAVALALAGCGGGRDDAAGEATLWITRDRGETVLFEGSVDAGQTVMQALRSRADVDTRYGGRFVQAIDGIEGSLERGWDWFFFVNGVAADRSAVEYRLGQGEIAWWDYRRWDGEEPPAVVVGAFPEPFLHGYGGERLYAVVRYEKPEYRATARAVAKIIGARTVLGPDAHIGPDSRSHVFTIQGSGESFEAVMRGPGVTFHASPAVARAVVRDPARYRFRYEVKP